MKINTKTVMRLSAAALGATGLLLTFAGDVALHSLHIKVTETAVFLMQIIGALYLAFAVLNWMTKNSLIGGIYNRPLAVANLMHFMIAGLALIKGLLSNPYLPHSIWIAGLLYSIFGIAFGIIIFQHPVADNSV